MAFRDAGCEETPFPDDDALRKLLTYLTGGATTEEYLPLLLEELAPAGEDLRAPSWRKDAVDPERPFRVAIIGAGMSGLLAAIRLQQAGVPYAIFEKNADVGGTWLENRYPGCRVDVPNHFYSYSFAQKLDWPELFSTQEVLLDYFRDCAVEFGVAEHIRFRAEVLSARWSDESCSWTLQLRTPEGDEDAFEAQALISAVGQLNRPKMPDIAGMERFEGPAFHSAEWDHGLDLRGKTVAVIGTGASAAQFVPILAEQAAELFLFQRTPPWLVSTPDYHDEAPAGLLWLFRHVPHYAQWYRFWLFWTSADGLLEAARVEPGWDPKGPAIGARNDELRIQMTDYLKEQLSDAPELLQKVIPDYPPAAKRILRDNGIWPATLKRRNVHLITEAIREVTARGVHTEGREYAVDAIIYGTGFKASRFLTPMKITGRKGIDLHEQWDGDARAYLGITVPSFPNFFCLYGPNTNIVVNSSITYFSECEVSYVLECIRLLLAGRHRAMDCKQAVHDEYNVRIDAGNLKMAWGVSSVNAWYKNDRGRVAQNWPFTVLEYWQQTRRPEPADYFLM